MAEIKNLSTQLEIIGSGGEFKDTIKFYNKRDLEGNIRLGVSAENGELIIRSLSVDGIDLTELERFKPSEITLPTHTSLSNLVEQINTFISTSSDLVIVDSVFARTGNVVAELGDYTASKVTNDSSVSGATVKDALNNLNTSATQIIGGVTLSSSSNTNILNGTYVILADTTTVTSVTSGIGQDSNWTLEITQAVITNQKGVVTFTGNLEKDAGGGANYDVAIFKNGSIVSESEQIDQKLESNGKGQSVTVMAIIEFSTNDTFDIRVSGNGTADDIFCGGGSLYIQ